METYDIIHSWPHNWYGFWRSPAHDYDDVPPVQAASDPSWNPDDKESLISYLEEAPIIAATMTRTTCLLCSSEVAVYTFQFDGVWFWHRSLAHYVRCHSVVLPDRFVQHIRDRGYTPPKEGELPHVPFRELPWPESCGGMRNLNF